MAFGQQAGQQQTSGFNTQQQQPSGFTGFGNTANNTTPTVNNNMGGFHNNAGSMPFGQSSGTFGQQQQATTFGSSPSNVTTGFGSSPSVSSGFNTNINSNTINNNVGFGGSSTFGQQQQQQQQQQQSRFGQNNNNRNNKPPPCTFFAQGRCRNGANCKFSHDLPPPGNQNQASTGLFGGGSGFGKQQQSQPTQQQQQQQQFGRSQAFGQQSQQTAQTSSMPFGLSQQSASSGFGQLQQQSSSFGFGNTAAPAINSSPPLAAPLMFGSSTTTTNNNMMGVGSLSTNMVGFAPAATSTTPPIANNNSSGVGFGMSSSNTQASSGFGGFGSSSSNTQSSTGFGNTATTGFNTTTTTPSASSGFGSSSNQPFGGGGNDNNNAPASSGGGFNAQASSGFGSSNTSSGFTGGFGGGNSNNNAFGTPPKSTNEQYKSAATPFTERIPRKSSQQQQQGGGMMDVNATPIQPSSNAGSSPHKEWKRVETKDETKVEMVDDDNGGGGGGDEQLAALRAKIQEKRKKLQKFKKPNEGSTTTAHMQAPSTVTKKKANQLGESTVALNNRPTSNEELAAKNALRFGTANNNKTLNNLLPTDLKGKSNNDEDTGGAFSTPVQSGDETEDDKDGDDMDGYRDLSNAKSLVGVCMSMCPDEELLRREREGDIQLLEVTDPGGLHPKEWTLRDTAVKRFRRSAADFKLDIPELVRPPEVLERVCGYLEEWIMERDRQGIDKRWARSQQPSDIPPPLDVYQFVWDRTRMIRKDFILQNYIGTGGRCDARAVRCHERIARWHAMCEHQLSHVPDFVALQSQQNIAELGQTMKSLNNYYDDSTNRSLVEVDTSNIQSERLATAAGGNKFSDNSVQGCASDIVMGKHPVDFDGSPLANDAQAKDIFSRIIGSNGAKSASLGTAEPEMRGLYILLTLNNEGGMEVLAYSARLCVQKPAIFYSKPVQLALSIFQARKDHNYAKFFSLLRSPSTPYLFSCIMFKYVANMRKDALTIMSKTYGAKHKATGEPFFDSYPLEDLVHLLCYEDVDEAKAACQHYGLVVEGDQVMWRHGKFKEPRDPIKGHIINLTPRKMIRTIESKLLGATRLSVCRGGVSGEGATLSDVDCGTQGAAVEVDRMKAQEAAEKMRKEAMKHQLEADAKAREQAELIEKERLKQQKLEAEKRYRAEAAKQAEMKRLEMERLQREQLMAEQKRKEEEAKRLAEAKEAAIRVEYERQEREAREREIARKKAEELKKEMERQRLLAKQREDEARRLAQIKAEEERIERVRLEQEERRRLAELQRKAEEERIRKAQEEKERRVEMMWREKIEKARKILVWRLWRKQMQKHNTLQQSQRCLDSLDPTTTQYPTTPIMAEVSVDTPINQSALIHTKTVDDLETKMFRLATASRCPVDISSMVAECLIDSSAPSNIVLPPTMQPIKKIILFKLAVLLPKRADGIHIYDTLRMWVNTHLRLGHVFSHTFTKLGQQIEVRSVAVLGGNEGDECNDCNAALFLLPVGDNVTSHIEFPEHAEELIASNVSRMVLILKDTEETGNGSNTAAILDHLVGSSLQHEPNQQRPGVVSPKMCHLDEAFKKCCQTLVHSHINSCTESEMNSHNDPSLMRVSLSNVGLLCLQHLLQSIDASCTKSPVFSSCKQALVLLAEELSKVYNELHELMQNWPPLEFDEDGLRSGTIPLYFDGQYDLPFDWHSPLPNIKERIFNIFQELLASESLTEFVNRSAHELSLSQRQELFTLIDNDEIDRCLVIIVSLILDGKLNVDMRSDEAMLYLPIKSLPDVIERVSSYESPSTPQPILDTHIPSYLYHQTTTFMDDDEEEKENDRVENIIETPLLSIEGEATGTAATKRKPREMMEQETPDNGRVKRIRSERRSREYTSFLESLL